MINSLKKMVPDRLSLRERAYQRHSDDLFISCKGNLLETFDELTGVRTLVERDDLKVPINYHDYDIEVLLKTNPQLLQPNQALLQRNCRSRSRNSIIHLSFQICITLPKSFNRSLISFE